MSIRNFDQLQQNMIGSRIRAYTGTKGRQIMYLSDNLVLKSYWQPKFILAANAE